MASENDKHYHTFGEDLGNAFGELIEGDGPLSKRALRALGIVTHGLLQLLIHVNQTNILDHANPASGITGPIVDAGPGFGPTNAHRRDGPSA